MKNSIKLLSCLFFFHISNQNLLASCEMFTRFSSSTMRRSLSISPFSNTLSGQFLSSSPHKSTNFTAIRRYSKFNDTMNTLSGNQLNSKAEKTPENSSSNSKMTTLLKKKEALDNQIKDCLDRLSQIEAQEKAILFRQESRDIHNAHQSIMESENLEHILYLKPEEFKNVYLKIKVDIIVENLIDRTLHSACASAKITKEDIKYIFDLYADLASRPQKHILKVLNASVDMPKNATYKAVLDHAKSRHLTVDRYRDIYMRLGEAFNKDPLKVFHSIVEEMIKEKEYSFALSKNRKSFVTNYEDYTKLIVILANPLYPLDYNEVNTIMDLYADLPGRSKGAIAKVLNGSTDTSKSVIYKAVMTHVNSKKSNLKTYRNIYAKLTNPLNRGAIEVIQEMILQDSYKDNKK